MATQFRDSLSRPIPWLESFDIDHGVLDDEHRQLIDAFNQVCLEALESPRRGRETLLRRDVVGLLASHFANEEKLFDQLDYAYSQQHRREHDHIRWLATPLVAAIDDQTFVQCLIQARTGLVEHLIRHDLGFKSHVQFRDGK